MRDYRCHLPLRKCARLFIYMLKQALGYVCISRFLRISCLNLGLRRVEGETSRGRTLSSPVPCQQLFKHVVAICSRSKSDVYDHIRRCDFATLLSAPPPTSTDRTSILERLTGHIQAESRKKVVGTVDKLCLRYLDPNVEKEENWSLYIHCGRMIGIEHSCEVATRLSSFLCTHRISSQ